MYSSGTFLFINGTYFYMHNLHIIFLNVFSKLIRRRQIIRYRETAILQQVKFKLDTFSKRAGDKSKVCIIEL